MDLEELEAMTADDNEPRLAAPEVAYILEDTGAKILFTGAGLREAAASACAAWPERLPLRHTAMTGRSCGAGLVMGCS
jgi:hypothetical protein